MKPKPLHPELQQFLLDELRNSDAYVIIATHSTIPLNYAKNINEGRYTQA
jgi:predicted ATP-dependent endonuclease of OLD family